jgi:multidrug efflux pump
MNFSDFFVSRPRFAIVLSIIIFVAGLIALPILPIGEYPEVVPPTVVSAPRSPGPIPR